MARWRLPTSGVSVEPELSSAACSDTNMSVVGSVSMSTSGQQRTGSWTRRTRLGC